MQRVPTRLTFVALTALVFADRPVLSLEPHAAALATVEHAVSTPASVVLNDNMEPAGDLQDGVLTLGLRAAKGEWRPEGPSGRVFRIEAFGADGTPLSVPAPLVRVPEGTEIRVRVRNDLDTPLRVGGLCERGGAVCPLLDVPPHDAVETRFKSGPPGTYHYWASSSGMPFAFRAVEDTQLSGAFIVDPPGVPPRRSRDGHYGVDQPDARANVADHVGDRPRRCLSQVEARRADDVNGRAWPHTERLAYDVGQTVRWRVVNLSTQVHPMHLHGFYFDVESLGDGGRDVPSPPIRCRTS